MMKTVTIITPTYNRAELLKKLYQSLEQQNNKDFEWLIVDDGSTDRTKEAVEEITPLTIVILSPGVKVSYFCVNLVSISLLV